MNFKNNYDSIEGIKEYLKFGLTGLHMLSDDRHAVGYDREERLNEFLVLGRYYLDTCGNFSICEFSHGHNYENVSWLQDSLPKVIAWKSLFETIKGISSCSHIFSLPPTNAICDECGDGWTINNAHDSIICDRYGDHPKFRHINCAKLYGERETLKDFQRVLNTVGLDKALLSPIPNEYYTNDGDPWYLVRTPKGTIKIGWRKHVINVDWSELVKAQLQSMPGEFNYEKENAAREKFGGSVLFPNDDVTKGDYYIHAYGYNKLEEYLLRLSEVARIGRFAGK